MILITNADSFIGKNITCFLEQKHFTVIPLSKHCTEMQLVNALKHTDFIINLMRIDFITQLIHLMKLYHIQSTLLTISDATHLNQKVTIEQALLSYAKETQTKAFIARLPIVFGKWGKPLIPTQLPQHKKLEIAYIDDVVTTFINVISNAAKRDSGYIAIKPTYTITADELAKIFKRFSQDKKEIPNLENPLIYKLYATYLSYVEPMDIFDTFIASPNTRDIKLIQSPSFGQISLLTLKTGEIYGDHWHHTLIEKYIILSGKARIMLRSILKDNPYTHDISAIESIIVPPAYTLQITNIGDTDLVILLWASEDSPKDTFFELA